MSATGDRERWARVQELFLGALDLPASERPAHLECACAGDTDLVDEVLGLLAAHEEGPLSDRPTERSWGGRHPERIGSYRIVRPLGEGGMGTVLLAVREAEGFTQTVALKVLHAGYPHRDLEARLEAERRILARLEHPGIARLIDGGVTEQGQPFFAMEYVQGEDILTWCDRRRLDVGGRIRLAVEVCEAVQHAHSQLVIHRDLKPSNILVTTEGRPKLLDFGVAKLLDEETAEGRTRTAAWITPAYASPEQLRGAPVSALSDVYALGVLLYELLVGVRPYRTTGRNPLQLERLLARSGPPRPGLAALDEGGAEGTDAGVGAPDAGHRAALRATTPERLRRRLAGDLDVIVQRAMAYDPERRYGSAAALAEDLRRHLGGWPVAARPDSLGYRASRFVRRHRIAVTAGALGLAAILAGSATTVWQANRARAEAVRAEAEADRARQVTALVTDLFRLSDPTQTHGDTVTARQLLDEGTRRIESELAGQPTLQATLLDEVGRVYRNLGLSTRAEELARRVVDIREQTAPGTREHVVALAALGEVTGDVGRDAEAVALLDSALSMMLAAPPSPGAARVASARRRSEAAVGHDTLAARIRASMGWELQNLGRHEEAAERFREALDVQRALLGDGHPATTRTVIGLASVLHDGGRFDEAEALLVDLLQDDEGAGRPDPVAAKALADLGMLRRLRQEYRAAEPLLRAALEQHRTLYGPDHPETIVSSDSWGVELAELGRLAEARDILTETLERSRRVLGPEHTATVSLTEALAWALVELGRYEEAFALQDSAVAVKRRIREGDHPGIVYSLLRAAQGANAAGRTSRAAESLDSARAMGRRLSSGEGVYRGLALQEEATVAAALGDAAAAAVSFAEAERILGGELRPDHRYVQGVARARALFRLRSGGDPGPLARELEAIAAAQRLYRPSPHQELGRTMLAVGEARLIGGDRAAAAAAFRQAEADLARLPASHWLRGWARAGLALAEDRAESAQEALTVVERHVGVEAPQARALRRLVDGA